MRDDAGAARRRVPRRVRTCGPRSWRSAPRRCARSQSSNPSSRPTASYLDDILRCAPHTLTAGEEKIVAQAGRMADAGSTIRDVFKNAEMPYPTVTLSTGEKVRLDDAAYTQYRALAEPRRSRHRVPARSGGRTTSSRARSAPRSTRRRAGAHLQPRRAQVRELPRGGAVRRQHPDARLHAADRRRARQPADAAPLPEAAPAHDGRRSSCATRTSTRPIVNEVDLRYTPEQAMELDARARGAAGQGLRRHARARVRSRLGRLDADAPASARARTAPAPTACIRTSSRTSPASTTRSSTLAHESGHSMHTYLADQHQPYVTHDYATSSPRWRRRSTRTCCSTTCWTAPRTSDTRLFLLGSYLDNLRGTLFRQTMFAEFELEIHEMAEKGETLTGENLSEALPRAGAAATTGTTRACAGSTSCTASSGRTSPTSSTTSTSTSTRPASSPRPRSRTASATRRAAGQDRRSATPTSRMLSSGSSKYPIDLLKDAGRRHDHVGARSRPRCREMNAVMDEIEKLLR